MKQVTTWFVCALTLLGAVQCGAAVQVNSGSQDQTGVEITVYNDNLGLVKDARRVRLESGVQELRFADVAAQIIPASVSIRSLDGAGSTTVLEQNYEYDLLSPAKLLDKYVGRQVQLVTRNQYTDKEETVTATLLANNDGQPVYRIGSQVTFGHPGRVIFPEIPENLMARPTLVWLLKGGSAATHSMEALYLTGGLGWRADYVLVLDDREHSGDLSGWVTIDNRSGATYRDARLKLVAGQLNRVADAQASGKMFMRAAPMAAELAVSEESLFEYHLYTLERPTTLKENQSKQVSLLDVRGIGLQKDYLLNGQDHLFRGRYEGSPLKQKMSVYLEIANNKANRLGVPLPKGTFRVYKHDAAGSIQFIGEDAIDHTAKDENLRIKLGEAFDLVAERTQTDWQVVAKNSYEAAFRISLRNHKQEDVTVRVLEPVPGDWKVLESSHPHGKKDAGTLEFRVPVPKDREVQLVYRVRLRF